MRETQDVVYYDRYEKRVKVESIYGDRILRWTYGSRVGRFFLETVVKRGWFSSLYGRWADCACSRGEIGPFVDRFGIDVSEFADPPESFANFNEFFHRRLEPAARPLPADESAVVFPADGRHLLVPDLSLVETLYAKGQRLDLVTLLGSEELGARFARGSAVLSRLCPTDYHRFHFPLGGMCGMPRLVNGSLYAVNPIALAGNLNRIWQNKRRITVVSESPVGDYLFLEIGATNVGSIVDTARPDEPVRRGDEKGYFRFGGSMIITLFPKNRIRWSEDLAEQSAAGVELYARVNDTMGEVREG